MGLLGTDFAALLTSATIRYGSATPEDLRDIAAGARQLRSIRAMLRRAERLMDRAEPALKPAVRGQVQTALREIRCAIGCGDAELAAQRADVLNLILEMFHEG